jgi:acyl-CoA hydrolase/ABC-type branched-subunit amino acid transport system substrate-binding protein
MHFLDKNNTELEGQMSFKEIYKQKLITIPEAVSKVQSHQTVVTALVGSEPAGLLHELGNHKARLEDVDVYVCLPVRSYSYLNQDDMAGHFNVNSWFYSQQERDAHSSGRISYCPNNLHSAASLLLNHTKNHVNVFFGTATPPDEKGYMSLSLSLIVEKQIMEAADLVILEINENLPYTYGDTLVHVKDVDFLVENNFDVPVISGIPSEPWQETIGGYIAEMIEDGSTLQLGIGGIPNAITPFLTARRDLGIHTEMFVDGFLDLIDAGAISGKRKTLWKEKMICTFALGSQRLYDFIDRNVSVEMHQGRVVNDPFVIAQNYKMISVNTAITLDVIGQICSQSLGPRHFSGTGGQLDYHLGAQKSDGGRGIIALKSTAKGGKVSTIVPMLPQGSEITVPSQYADTIVTEFGVADLKGKSVKQRMEALIKISHPDFREWIRDEAHRIGIVPKLQVQGFRVEPPTYSEPEPVGVPGVLPDKILLGTCLDLTGPNATLGLDMLHGLTACFDFINSSSNGVHGRKIELLVEDHAFDVTRAKEASRKLVEEEGVFAMVAPLGTPINLAIMEYLLEKNLPVIAPISGISAWSEPHKRNYFAYQTSYHVEGQILAQYAVDTLKPERVAILAVDDKFGHEGTEAVLAELKKSGVQDIHTVYHKLGDIDPDHWLEQIRSGSGEGKEPDLVILYTYLNPAGTLLRAAYQAGFKPQWLGSNVVSGPGLFSIASDKAADGVRTGCFPPGPSFHRGERLYRKNMAGKYSREELGTYNAVAYAVAQLTVEGLTQAGRTLTRDSFIAALEGLKNWTGGIHPPISYSAEDHRGLKTIAIQRAVNGKWLREKATYELKE